VKPTNPLWYLAAFLIALGSVMAATAVAAGAWQPVRDATVSPTLARADASGKSLAVFTDIVQPDRDISCQATDLNKKVIQIPNKDLDITVDDNGDRWHLIGMLRDGSNGLKVHCTPRDRKSDNATYAYAVVTGYDSKVNTGKGIAILGATIGAALGAYTYYCRRQRRQELADEPA
jgi:hypothetical protein